MKGVSELSGLRSIRTMGSTGKRSIPRIQSSTYLDLYMLRKEKERLEKENYILEKRKMGVEKRLMDIDNEMKKLQAEGTEEKERRIKERIETPTKEWKKMKMKY